MSGPEHAHHDHQSCHSNQAEPVADDARYDNVPADFTGTVFTCPMHPQVRDTTNTGCPICGMALEPETITLDQDEDTSELDDMTRRFRLSAFLSFPLFIYAMGEMIPGRPFEGLMPGIWAQWLQVILAAPVVL